MSDRHAYVEGRDEIVVVSLDTPRSLWVAVNEFGNVEVRIDTAGQAVAHPFVLTRSEWSQVAGWVAMKLPKIGGAE